MWGRVGGGFSPPGPTVWPGEGGAGEGLAELTAHHSGEGIQWG